MSQNQATSDAYVVYDHARESVSRFADAFDLIRKSQGKKGGRPSHAEQDQLRAALVFAAAGLDSTLKHLIREAIRPLAGIDSEVRKGLEDFVTRQIRGDGADGDSKYGSRFFANVLVSDSPQDSVIEQYVIELTGSSLQSHAQVLNTISALGLNSKALAIDISRLKLIFQVRNKIIHELDVNLRGEVGRRNRQDRAYDDMVGYAETLLAIAKSIVDAVDAKIQAAT